MNGRRQRTQEETIAALLSHSTDAEAARALGISEVTLWRRKQDPAFQRAYAVARHQMVEGVVARLQASATEAVETLRGVMNATDGPPSSRVAAARFILDLAIRATETERLMARVEELEERLQQHEEELQPKRENA